MASPRVTLLFDATTLFGEPAVRAQAVGYTIRLVSIIGAAWFVARSVVS